MEFLEACTNFLCRFGVYICSFYVGLFVGQFSKLYIEKVRTSEPETVVEIFWSQYEAKRCIKKTSQKIRKKVNMKEPEKPDENKTE